MKPAYWLALLLGVAAFGIFERHQGAVQAQDRADLQVRLLKADSTLFAYRQRASQDSAKIKQDSLKARSESVLATRLGVRADSLELALRGDTGRFVLRDSALAVVGARDSQIAHLTLANLALTDESAVLLRGIAGRDSTIASLSAQLTNERHATAQALARNQPGFLGTVSGVVVKGLAVYGLIRLVRG